MIRFGYIRDPLFLAATGAYALNRWLLKPWVESPFLRGQMADLLMVPAALPLLLWIHRGLALRRHDLPPTWMEIVSHTALWAWLCEFAGPRWLHVGVADPWDVVAYAVGGCAAWLWWNRGQPIRQP